MVWLSAEWPSATLLCTGLKKRFLQIFLTWHCWIHVTKHGLFSLNRKRVLPPLIGDDLLALEQTVSQLSQAEAPAKVVCLLAIRLSNSRPANRA
jgi:hypothetical protein